MPPIETQKKKNTKKKALQVAGVENCVHTEEYSGGYEKQRITKVVDTMFLMQHPRLAHKLSTNNMSLFK
jgi:hypothetical protein